MEVIVSPCSIFIRLKTKTRQHVQYKILLWFGKVKNPGASRSTSTLRSFNSSWARLSNALATTERHALPHPHAASTRSAPHPGEADPPSESTPMNHDHVSKRRGFLKWKKNGKSAEITELSDLSNLKASRGKDRKGAGWTGPWSSSLEASNLATPLPMPR